MASELQEKLNALRIDREETAASRSGAGLKIGIGALAVAVVAGAAWWGLRSRAVPVRTVVVEEPAEAQGGASTVLNASGYVTARRQATVSSKVTGKVVDVLVEEGMKVEKGQILARLDPSQAQQALALSQAQLEATRRSMVETEAQLREATIRKSRLRDLLAAGVSSKADWDAIEAEVDVFEARLATQRGQVATGEREVDIQRQYLDDTIIRAPFAGVAVSKNAQPGEMISPTSAGGGFTRTGISTIVDMSSLEIEVDVNEAYIQRVQPGQKVQATLDAYRDWSIPAHVITTIPAADRQKATVTVRIGFDQLDPRILPDMGIKVAFLAEPAATGVARSARVVRVPRGAVRGSPGEEFVFVVGSDNKLERRAVTLAPGGEDPAQVIAGLAAGERIAVDGPADLAAGVEIAERPQDRGAR
jgi:RND family efflux transporter MFP subunit